jgi:uncharacterized protein
MRRIYLLAFALFYHFFDSHAQAVKQAGTVNAYFLSGRNYQLGINAPQDFKKAAGYYEQGAKAGDKQCQNALAYLHFKGLGVSQDYKTAFRLFKASAAEGNINSMYFLGICFRNAYGTTVDEAQATYWLRKAALEGEKAAMHELYEEPVPENRSVVSPALQQQLNSLQTYSERYKADNSNNYEGSYQGMAIYYDWSGRYVTEMIPLQLDLSKTADGYSGTWKEGKNEAAPVSMKTVNNKFIFNSGSAYIRQDHYSGRKMEVWHFNQASLDLSFMNDNLQLSGYVQFYSPYRKEPGKPLQIILNRKIETVSTLDLVKSEFNLLPNPAISYTAVQFKLSNTATVGINVYSSGGALVYSEQQRILPAGAYRFSLPTNNFSSGAYTVQLVVNKKTQSKILIKK